LLSENTSPTANVSELYSGYVNEQITFDRSGSTDPDGTVNGYRWDDDISIIFFCYIYIKKANAVFHV
jgi:hypothetical protein